MRPDDLIYWVRQVPFVPFRIRLNSGRTFDIRHPEMLRIGRSSAIVFSYVGGPSEPYEKLDMIGMVLIEGVEPLEAELPA